MTSNDPTEILIALGANMPSRAGPPAETLKAALAALGAAGVNILQVSAFIETAAWPNRADPHFTNAVAAVQTSLQPFALLELLHVIETAYGRVRSQPNAPRTLDLDLLAHGTAIVTEPGLELPHPRMAQRRFVLEPLAQIAPHWRHPVTGLTVVEMLAALSA
jgi:2-amino-4-hydroxy-6-hydroxymethyldihydropteridine diphosphokinase